MDPFAILTANRAPEPDRQATPHLWALILAFMVLLAVAVSLLGPQGEATPSPAATSTPEREARTYTVAFRSGVFSPTNLRIHVGDTVVFRNDGTLPVRVIGDGFDSVTAIAPGETFSYTFATAGVFGYHTYADENQTGGIIVRE